MTATTTSSTAQRPAASRHPLAPLFNADTVQLRCTRVLQSVRNNLSAHFRLDAAAQQRLAHSVLQQLQRSPVLDTAPEHAAPLWQHLQSGGVDRLAELAALLAGQPEREQARAWADLAVLGALLSADPGPRWRCVEQQPLATAAFAQAEPDDLLALLDRAGRTARINSPAAAAAATPAGDAATDNAATPAVSAPDAPAAAPESIPSEVQSEPAAPPAPAPTTLFATAAPAAAADSASPAPPAGFAGAQGLVIATFRAFVAGAFSSDRSQPCRVDAATLRHVDVAALRALFQGTPLNPLQGLEGRAAVLSRLGQVLQALPGADGAQARACDLLPEEALAAVTAAQTLPTVHAPALLGQLLRKAAGVWPAPLAQGLPAGDAWQHLWAGAEVGTEPAAATPGQAPAAAATDLGTTGWVPLHAMAQALVAALALPLAKAGRTMTGLERLSACADHQTTGLLMAAGVLVPRHQRLLARPLKLADEAVVECRAATVACFHELTALARSGLQPVWGAEADRLTVAQVVQATLAVVGGQGAPALRIEGDGALF